MSNSVSWTLSLPPAKFSEARVLERDRLTVTIQWLAPGDDWLTGRGKHAFGPGRGSLFANMTFWLIQTIHIVKPLN